MKYYSEKTQKLYDSVDELRKAEAVVVEAERKAKAEKEAAKAKEEAKRNERANRAKVVEAAYDQAKKARKDYLTVLEDFCRDYGAYHQSYTSDEVAEDGNWIDSLLNFLL